jgi:hypothetical protein
LLSEVPVADAEFRISARDDTRGAFASVRRSIDDLKDRSESLGATFSSVFAGLSAFGVTAFVKSAIDAADALDELAQKSGVTVEKLSELGYVAKIENISMDALGDGMRKLSVNLQAAGAGSKELQAAFQAVGISAAELRTIGADAALLRLADAFAGAEDGAGKTAIAVKLLGRAGSDFIPLLNRGSAGLREAGEEARRFGLVVSTEAAAAAGQFNDNLTRFTASVQAFGIALGNFALPSLTKFTEELLEGQRIFGSFASALFNIGFAIDPFKSLGQNLAATRKELEQLTRSLNATPIGDNKTRAAIETQIDTLQKRLEFLKFQERQRITTGNPSTFDARDRQRLQAQAPKTVLTVPDDPTTDKTSKLSDQIERGSERGAAFLAKIYFDQFDAIRKRARELNAELLQQFEEGNQLDARVAKEQADALDRVLGGTKSGQERAVFQDLEVLNNALVIGRINAVQYEEAYEQIQDRLNKIRGVSGDVFPALADDGVKAFERLRFAVEGWGRAFTNTLATAVETGKLQLGELVDSVLKDLLRLQIQRSLTEPLFGALQGGLGRLFAGGAPASGGAGYSQASFPLRDSGGPGSAGQPYLIGRGAQPELFVPRSAGTFYPRGTYGGQNFNVTVNVDARADLSSVREAIAASTRLMQAELSRSSRRG